MMLRRGFLLAAPALVSGCGMLNFMAMRRQDDPTQVAEMAGFISSGERLIYTGEVRPGADEQLGALLDVSPDVTTLELDMVAGEQGSDAAMALGRRVRSAGLATQVREGSMVSGAGTDVFLAGDPRIIEDGATLEWRGRNMGRAPEYTVYLDEMTGNAEVATFLDSEAPRLRSRPLSTLDIQRLEIASDGITGPFADIGQEIN